MLPIHFLFSFNESIAAELLSLELQGIKTRFMIILLIILKLKKLTVQIAHLFFPTQKPTLKKTKELFLATLDKSDKKKKKIYVRTNF